jgi:predicted metal-dependent phosphoesterase TrpH
MPTLEFHCHTIYSKDSVTRPEDLVRTARLRGIDRLVVTDHNTIGGALETQKLDPELVIVGEEILTTQGELLAAFVTEEIPPRLTPIETIRRLRDQGAFISVSHPFDERRGWSLEHLQEITPLVDAIEVFNSRCIFEEENTRAEAFARENGLPGTVGSDAHTLVELGQALMILNEDFHDVETLKSALIGAATVTRRSSPLIRLASRHAVLMKKLGLVRQP